MALADVSSVVEFDVFDEMVAARIYIGFCVVPITDGVDYSDSSKQLNGVYNPQKCSWEVLVPGMFFGRPATLPRPQGSI